MRVIKQRAEAIKNYILMHVEDHPNIISSMTAKHFNISRQAVNKHLKKLVKEKILSQQGQTKGKTYYLATLVENDFRYSITNDLKEDVAWRNDIKPLLNDLPKNVLEIWQHGFTEMLNNAIDHSQGKNILVDIKKTATTTEIFIQDDGIGIFKKIQTTFNLLDERHAILELAKGKLTTDPKNHSGEGIFFSSRMFDSYNILSGQVFYTPNREKTEDWISEPDKYVMGTIVWMKLSNNSTKSSKKIFDEYTLNEHYGFNKTVVPVKLAQYGDDKLISRSQAKRLLVRIELFKNVIFDFKGVDSIGQAFADEIFRVFANEHPEIEFTLLNANSNVKQMIERANQ